MASAIILIYELGRQHKVLGIMYRAIRVKNFILLLLSDRLGNRHKNGACGT